MVLSRAQPVAGINVEMPPGGCYDWAMLEPRQKLADEEAATQIYSDMPNYVGSEAEFLAAVEVGLADLDAGRTVSSEVLVAKYRRINRPA
jgi:predicted transcriptional regulator